jgi:hypothetical protein
MVGPVNPVDPTYATLYLRFTLSYRDVEELLAGRGLDMASPSRITV